MAKENPKLFDAISEDPKMLLDVRRMFEEHDAKEAQKIRKMQEDKLKQEEQQKIKQRRKYSIPFFWKWANPIFTSVSALLIKLQFASGIPWLPYIILCGVTVRLVMAPLMIRQMTLINKMGNASGDFRILLRSFRKCYHGFFKKCWLTFSGGYNLAKQTGVSLTKFYFYNIIQLPVFIIMVMSIRKIAFECQDLQNTGTLWFPNLNDPDPYLILPILATVLNYINLGRGITKENEHWFVNRFRSFFQVIQFMHLPFTHQWPAGVFVYWVTSSTFVLIQQTLLRRPNIMKKINPMFFTNYMKLYGERSPKDHENYVERLMNIEDPKLKAYTNDDQVVEDLQLELKKFTTFRRVKQAKETKDFVTSKIYNKEEKKEDI